MAFAKATKEQAKLRMALMGPAGAGKTMTALRIASALGTKIAVADTEAGSASKYAGRFAFDTDKDFPDFHPERFIKVIRDAEKAGYEVLVIDSLSHAWGGKGGALELVDQEASRQKTPNSYTAWGKVTPIWNHLLETIVRSNLHVIVTLRSKMDHIQDKDSNGRTVIRKVGMAPVARDGAEYEFDVVMDLDDGKGVVTKSRAPDLNGKVIHHPGEELGETLKAWLSDGEPVAAPEPPPNADVLQAWQDAFDTYATEDELMSHKHEVDGIANTAVRKTVGGMFNARRRELKAKQGVA